MFSAMSDKSDCTELLVRSGAAVSTAISSHDVIIIYCNIISGNGRG